jgi:hypothetical protein
MVSPYIGGLCGICATGGIIFWLYNKYKWYVMISINQRSGWVFSFLQCNNVIIQKISFFF